MNLKLAIPFALSFLLASCGGPSSIASSSSHGDGSSSGEPSSLSSSSSSAESSSSPSQSSSSSASVPEEGIPGAMEGTWVGASGTRRFELLVTDESLFLNGAEGEIVSPFKTITGGYRGTVDFGGATLIVDYYSSPISGEICVELSDGKENVRLYKDGNAMPPLPSRMEGTWEGVDLFAPEDPAMHELVLGDGAPRLDGISGILWEVDPISYEALLSFGDLQYEVSYVESGSEALLDVYCEETGFQALMEKTAEGEEEGSLLTAPEEMWGTWEGDGHVAIVGEKGLWTFDGATPREVTLKEDGSYYLLLDRASCYLKLREDEEGPYLELTSLQEALNGILRKA